MWQEIAAAISGATGGLFDISERRPVGGGSINDAYVVSDGRQRFFVKLNRAPLADMFAAEAEGLGEIAATETIACPHPIVWGTAGASAYLVLEHLALDGRSSQAMETFGRQLAALHRCTRERYGWHRDNTIGSTPQENSPADDWVAFWRQRRLGFQLALAADNGYGGRLQRNGERLMEALPAFFSDYTPAPSLLHGDLWSGNFAVTAGHEPVIFDPAVYYGDREADIAMTELFGNFGGRFYQAYGEAYALDAGYGVRKTLYNLYHILNHLNLFGSGYQGQAEAMLERLLSEVR